MSKSELWWVSVGGAKCEPARVVTEEGRRVVYTIGCTDPHEMEGVELVKDLTQSRPLTPAAANRAREAWERKVERDRAAGIHRGYRKFDAD